MATIELENLTKYFGNQLAVEDVSLQISDGEFLVFVGPSGCGKTTTLNMIAGFEDPSSGQIKIEDVYVTDMAPGARDLGMVFQNLALFPHMSVKQNIEFGLEIKKVPASEAAKRVKTVAETVKIEHLMAKRPGQLSGGERNRVHMALMLLSEANVLLLDEPTNDLDVETLRALEDAITAFAGCVVVISHDRWFLDRIVTHIIAFEGDSQVVWFEGNYEDYEADRHRRLGIDADQPHRIKYKPLKRG